MIKKYQKQSEIKSSNLSYNFLERHVNEILHLFQLQFPECKTNKKKKKTVIPHEHLNKMISKIVE